LAKSDIPARRVFIAATYDLENERGITADAIRRAGAVPVSVEWWEPATLIGRAVSSSDLLLLIIGERSGSVTPANITYLEYEYGLARRAGIPVAAIMLLAQTDERRRWFFERLHPDFGTDIRNIEELPKAVENIVDRAGSAKRGPRWDGGKGVLRVTGASAFAAGDVGQWLLDLDNSYSNILAFFEVINDAFVALRPELLRETTGSARTLDLIAPSERLRFHGASFSSPGWWEVFGKLNPLEVIRQYLNDRHERRKDRQYREAADRTRLDLENDLLRTKVIAEKFRLAQEIGVPERDLTAAANEMLLKPLRNLNSAQDEGIIQSAEIREPPLLEAGEGFEDHYPEE
jgi:hypothetical protein